MSQEDMNEILAGLPVQLPGQPGPDLEGGPRFPPLTQDEINQIFANIPPQPTISQDEINRIFDSVPLRSLTTEEMNQVFASIPQQTIVSEDELNRIFNGLLQQSGASGTESQTTENLPLY